jgi:hypothetical protein
MLVVFTGPSLDAGFVGAALPAAVVEPPACRGDIERAVARGATRILLIDGGFAHRLAVAPSEIVAALRAGVDVVGAASLGALRAAECHPAGMQGVGAVQRLYRLGVLTDDDEVAVATEPDRGFRATSIALVNVRFAVLAALRAGLVGRRGAEAMLAAAKRTHFSERLWAPILKVSGAADRDALSAVCLATDIKQRDAERAVAYVAGAPEPPPRPVPVAAPPRASAPEQYFGLPREVARDELVRWLTSSGRYRRYWDAAPDDAEAVWSELETRGALGVELMRWYAFVRVGGAPLANLR